MAFKGPDGKLVLSAGEIGAYTVCPSAWKLQLEGQPQVPANERGEKGERLHREWSKQIESMHWLERGVRMVSAMTITAIIIYLLLGR